MGFGIPISGVDIIMLLEGMAAGTRLSHTKLDDIVAASHHTQTPVSGLAIFGDGSDGDSVTAGGGAGDLTLTRDMFYNDLTITAGDVMTTAGWRVFVKGTLTNNGIIENIGTDAVDNIQGIGGVGGSLGSGGDGGGYSAPTGRGGGGGGGGGVVLICAKTIINNGTISANGGDGVQYGAGDQFGKGTDGQSRTSSLGGSGGKGGSVTNTGGNGGSVTVPATDDEFRCLPFAIILKQVETTILKINGGGGGGSGACDGVGDTGGGGGGGGGLLVLIYNTLTAGIETADGGALGLGTGTGQNGVAGTAGLVRKIANSKE